MGPTGEGDKDQLSGCCVKPRKKPSMAVLSDNSERGGGEDVASPPTTTLREWVLALRLASVVVADDVRAPSAITMSGTGVPSIEPASGSKAPSAEEEIYF